MADPVISAAPAPAAAIRSRARLLRFEIPEIWKRFLLALLGLVLAFAAALFSTVARESGSLWTTVILASIALTLAVVVGLTTVPYLARRVAGGRVRDAFNYDVTGVGIIYVVAVLLIGVAALNTGNNLLYVIVAAMLAAILVSGVASAIVLRDLELDIRLPEQVFAGRPTLGKIVIRNRRRWLPSFSISVVPLKQKPSGQWQWVPTTFGFPPSQPPDKQWVRLPDRQLRRVAIGATPPGIFTQSAYFPYIPAAAELAAELELCFPRRGRYQQDSFGLATRFPFAFLTKTRRVPLPREILVYPPVEATDEFFEVLPLITGQFETFARGRGDDLYLIREYLPEDSARHVDWKATAKSGSLKVREFSREDERKLRIVFDNPAPGTVSEQAYENAVTAAASLGWHFAETNADLCFVAQDYRGGTEIHDFLSYLATVAPQPAESVLDTLEISGDYNIILTTRPGETIPASLWAGSYFIFIGTEN
ncbi:MAG TPA: DUF58 domain-containing protein [Terriglobales bacterium]|jgi:uncharacterized protein (DUF58 family)|nr:DUF58 domain-containing protein [Terriglobales bacterium]